MKENKINSILDSNFLVYIDEKERYHYSDSIRFAVFPDSENFGN